MPNYINFPWPGMGPNATIDELFGNGAQAEQPSVFPMPHVPMPQPFSRTTHASKSGTHPSVSEPSPALPSGLPVPKDEGRLPVAAPQPMAMPSGLPIEAPSMAAPSPQPAPAAPQTNFPMAHEPRQTVVPQAPKRHRTGYTVDEYKRMLAKATEAGDTAAQAYFQGQIAKGLQMHAAQSKGLSGRDHGPLPDQGNIADAALQGLTFGFSDELASAAA